MNQHTAQRADRSRSFRIGFFSWLALLLLACAGSASLAQAAASPFCPTFNVTVPSGGSIVLDASACDGPDDFGIGFVETFPAHGTATTNTLAETVTYSNNGDGATSDVFIFDDGNNNDVTVNVTILSASPITISPSTLSLTVGVPVSQQFTATGGTAPYTWNVSAGTLPAGVSFSASGLLSGTPTARGNHVFTLRALDSAAVSATRSFSVTAANPTLSFSPVNPTGGFNGIAYSFTFTPTGGVAPYTIAHEVVNGPLPPGLSLSGATLSGTPTSTGTFTFGLRITDSSTGPGTYFEVESVTLVVTAAPVVVVNPTTLPGMTVGTAYSQTVTGSGGTAPYSFSITAGALPAGLALNGVTGVISGTPTAAGAFNFTVRAADANSFAGTRAYTVVSAPPTITIAPVTLAAATVATATSQTISASGGTAPYTYAVTAGALPAGVSLSASGTLSGTPTAGGPFNVTITATDSSTGSGAPFTGSRAYTWTVNPATIALPASPLANGVTGTAYSATIGPANGGTLPYSYAVTAGALPAGLSVSSAGALSGTPTAAGTFNFSVTATDSSTGTGPYTATRTYSLIIDSAVPVAGAVSATVAYGSGANPITLNLSGGAATSVSVSGAATHGTAIASGTSITYQPAAGYAGPDSFTYTATNIAGTSTPATVTITVGAPTLAMTPASGAIALTYGAATSQSFVASGGAAPYSYAVTAGSLPAGVSLDGAGLLSGTPTQPGSYPVSIRATDISTGPAAPFSVTSNVVLQVAAPTIAITPTTLPAPVIGAAYSQTVVASGGIAPYSYALTAGALPVGLSFNAAGQFAGTSTASGTYNLTVTATDANGQTGARAYSFTISVPSLALSPASLPSADAGVAYSQAFTTSGGVAPYSYSLVAGALPPGVSLTSSGVLSGTPTAAGSFAFSIQSTDSTSGTAATTTVSYSLAVAAPTITITPATIPNGTVGIAYSASLGSSGGTAPYSYSVTGGGLPPGVSINAAGVFSGTPSSAGSFNVMVTSTDNLGFSGSLPYTITIGNAPPIAIADAVTAVAEQATTFAVTGNDTGVYTSIAIVSGPAHGAASVSGLGINYTSVVGFSGADSLTYTLSGPGGTSAPATVSITVTPLPVPTGTAQTATTLAGQAVAINAAAGATGGPFTGVTIVTPPASGTAVVTSTTITFTPPSTASGAITFTYTLNNAYGASAVLTATVTVNAIPIPVARHVTALPGTPVVIDLTAGASGGPFTAATLVSLTPAGSGIATIVQVGSGAGASYQLTYTPSPSFVGTATVTFTVTNAFATSAPTAILIDVGTRPDPTKDADVMGLLGAQAAATRRFASAQIGNFQQRMEAMHRGDAAQGGVQNRLTFSATRRCRDDIRQTPGDDCLNALSPTNNATAPLDSGQAISGGGAGQGGGDTTIWTGGTLSQGDRDSRSGSSGFDFDTSGISAGIDFRLSDDFALGGGVGYGRDDTDIGRNGTHSDADSYTAAVYGSYHPGESFYLDGLLGYQWLSFDSSRHIAATGGQVIGQRDGTQWFASLSAGADFRHDRLQVSPYLRVDIARATLDGYTEHGDALRALSYLEQDVDTTTASLGLRLDYRHDLSFGTFSPQFRIEYQHDFEGDSTAILSYADQLSGPFYRAELPGFERNRFLLGIGGVWRTNRDLTFRFEYRGLFGSGDDTDHGLLLNLEKRY